MRRPALQSIARASLEVVRGRITRYFVAGAAVSLGYAATAIALLRWVPDLSPIGANAVSMVLWTPVSYLAHSSFSFRVASIDFASFVRFALVFVAKLLASTGIVWLVWRWIPGWDVVSIVANLVVLPLLSYAVLALWVFEERVSGTRSEGPGPLSDLV